MKQAYGTGNFGKVTDQAPVVETTCGKVLGENREGVAIFRGIPYGADCGGEHRFLPPRPAEAWEGIRDCTKNGHYAVQMGTSISGSEGLGPYFSGGKPELFGVAEEQQGEDCLVLNVLTPELPSAGTKAEADEKSAAGTKVGADEKFVAGTKAEAGHPVLVYIHGGGFATGSGTLVLGADQWVREEDLVVVGVNHRLNLFGYLYLGAFDKKYEQSGMAGMLDLVLALEWVRDNIAAFGGDPSQVTIMGESGGGMKVSTLMAMEKAKGLFCRAIVESGSGAVGSLSREEATAQAKKVLDSLGIPENHLEKLAEIPAEKLLALTEGSGLGGFSPVADGINLDYNEPKTIQAYDTSAEIPLLIGASEDELAVFAAMGVQDLTWDNILQKMTEGGKGPMSGEAIPPERAEKMLKVFRETDKKGNSAEHLYLKMVSLGSFLGGGAFHQALAKAEQGTAPVYHYMISYDAPHPILEGKRYAWHTADLPLQMRIVLHQECEALSKMMAHSWAAFIRTGNPSTEELNWPEFQPDTKKVMVFDEDCQVKGDPYQVIRKVCEE